MSQVPANRRILGWLLEGFWLTWVLLTTPFLFFWRKRSWDGKRKETVLILCDAFSTPLLYLRLARRFCREDYKVHILATGSIFKGLAAHAESLGSYLEENDLKQVIIIGHGMGGLIPLKLADAPRQRIIHLTPLGSPFNGTRLLLPFRFVPALRDMAVGSEYILYNRANAMLYADFTPFTAWQDEGIIPFNLSRYGQGRDLILDRVGHFNLIRDAGNINTILEITEELHPNPLSIRKGMKGISPEPADATSMQSQSRPSHKKRASKAKRKKSASRSASKKAGSTKKSSKKAKKAARRNS